LAPGFLEGYPAVKLTLHLTDSLVDIIEHLLQRSGPIPYWDNPAVAEPADAAPTD
jgi:hypothetical protein